MRLLVVVLLLLVSGCGKYGFHDAPACNKDYTVRSSGAGGFAAPYWYTVDGSGPIDSGDLKAVGSTVCLYVD